MQLSIIILNYNTPEATSFCIESLIKEYIQEFNNKTFEIILVDNASTDGSKQVLEKITEKHASITFIQHTSNVGYAQGINRVEKYAQGTYLLFLNSDTTAFNKDFLKVIDFLDHNPRVAVLGGQLLNKDGSIQHSFGSFYSLPSLIKNMFLGDQSILSTENREKKVDWVNGACFFVRKDIFKKVKGFDEHFFMYVEDMDLCYRIKKAGYLVCYFPQVQVYHIGQGSSDRSFAIVNIYKGILYYFKKHHSYVEYKGAQLVLLLKALAAITIASIKGDTSVALTYKKALRIVL